MTEQIWKLHTPQYDDHAPDDWDGEAKEFKSRVFGDWRSSPHEKWYRNYEYRYHTKLDLLSQCLRLPQADRDALIEALQKPQRDWADDVWERSAHAYGLHNDAPERVDAAAVIRSMCRPKEASSIRIGNTVAYEKEKP